MRRHRYVFRDKRESEKSVMGNDGKPIKGVEDVKVGMQEIGYVGLSFFMFYFTIFKFLFY